MLVVVSVTLCLCAVAVAAIAKGAQVVIDRLGVDLMAALLWLGLAEWPSETRVPRKQTEAVRPASIHPPGRRRRRSPAPNRGLGLGRLRGHRP